MEAFQHSGVEAEAQELRGLFMMGRAAHNATPKIGFTLKSTCPLLTTVYYLLFLFNPTNNPKSKQNVE
jgi:hypothetical protein